MPMRTRVALLLTIAAVSTTAGAQTTAAHSINSAPELGLQYTYLRSNAPVGQCGCFSPQGGSASFAVPLHGGPFFLAGDVTVGHAGKIARDSYNLTLTAFTAGVRYRPGFSLGPVVPFGHVLAGGAHAGGTLVSGKTPAAADSSVVFASNVGGGLDLILRPESHFSLRLVEADYLVTLFHNGQNDHQNMLRLSAGVVIHFGRR
jgi:outer membrane immunogenic protein